MRAVDRSEASVDYPCMRKKIGKLDCLWRAGDDEKRCVVLLHGFGADAADLFPLADFLDPDGAYSFVFPEAPLEVPVGPMMMGRGWFPLSLRELEGGLDFTQIRPPHMSASVELVRDLIFHLDCTDLVLGGFSQGAMIATEVALVDPEVVRALVLYSGTLLDEQNWMKAAKNLAGKKLLMSHGVQDQVLPLGYSERLFAILKTAGMNGQFISFPGGHEIPLPVLQKTKSLISEVFSS